MTMPMNGKTFATLLTGTFVSAGPSYSKKSSSTSTICTVRRTCTPTP